MIGFLTRSFPRFLLVGWFVVPALSSLGQEQKYTIKSWTVEDGAPDNFVNQMVQDKRGYMWLGTAAGLARFDSVAFKEFRDTAISPDFGYNIRSISLTPEGTVLTLPASGGVVEWKAGRPSLHPLTTDLAGLTLLDLYVEPTGVIWIGAEPTSFIRWEKGKIEHFGQSEGIGRRVNRATFATDGRGRTWVATGEYFGYYQDGRLVPWKASAGALGTALLIAPARSGGVWVSSAERLIKVEHDRTLTMIEGSSWLGRRVGIQCLFEDSNGRLWIGTRRDGLHVYADGVLRKVALGTNLILSVMEDEDGNIWAGTAGEGLCRLRPMHYTILNTSTGLPSDLSSSVCEDASGAIWCANRAGGLVRYKDGMVQQFGGTSDAPLFASRVAIDTKGVVWMGSNTNLFRLTTQVPERFEPVQPAVRGIHFLYGSRDGRMWVASNLGLGFFQDGVYQSASNLPYRFEALAESQQGRILIAATESIEARLRARVLEFVDGNLVERISPEQWHAGPIHSLLFDHTDTLWIAAAGGLVLKQGDRLVRFTKAQGLPDEFIDQILEDDAGCLWMAGRRALFRVKMEDLLAVADGRLDRVTAATYGEDDGLLDAAAPGVGQPRSWKGADGRLWFTLYRGIVGVNPTALTAPQKPPRMYIEEVTLDQQPHSATEPRLEIAPGVQKVRFRFAVLNFSHPRHVLLRYQLEGFDRDWNEAGDDRTARYAYLPAGNYRLVVQALDQNGAWAPQEVSMLLHVESAWWQSRWFLLVVIALSIAVVASAARIWSVRKYKVRLRRLEEEHALERERARIARNLHDELGGSLTQIGLLADRLRRHRNMEEIEKTLGSLVHRTQGLATDLESIVWTVSPQNNSWDRLAAFASRHARLFFEGTGIECRVEGTESVPALPLAVDAQHEVLAICKEAMNNTLKHSLASLFSLSFATTDHVVEIRIQDNGAGFEPSLKEHSERNGLHNMRSRAEEIGARIVIESSPGAGTLITLTVPICASTLPPFKKTT